jgi:hypothetical protein
MHAASADVLDRLMLFTLGLAAGYLVGTIFAPEPGIQTRQRIVEGTREAARSAQRQAREAAEPLAERVRTTASEMAERHLPLASDFDVIDGKALARELTRPA